jgi:Skp family chaperone for outer membrane proteins
MFRRAFSFPALALVAVLAAPAGAQQLYKYVGPDGRVQYTDRPPAGAQNVEKVTGSRVSTVGPAAPTTENAAKSAAPRTPAEQEQAFRQRRAEAEANAKKQDKLAQDKRASDQQCDAMRRQLAGIRSGGRIAVPNAQGERIFLDDTQIQNEATRLQGEIAANCNK